MSPPSQHSFESCCVLVPKASFEDAVLETVVAALTYHSDESSSRNSFKAKTIKRNLTILRKAYVTNSDIIVHLWASHQPGELFHSVSLRKMLLIYENSFGTLWILQPWIAVLLTFFLRLTTNKLIPSHCLQTHSRLSNHWLRNSVAKRRTTRGSSSKEKSEALKLFSRYHCF